jgi:DnaJ-domain-containing protein 1
VATDYFAFLQEKRRPWIDPEHLKQKFLALSGSMHPDRVHSGSEEEKLKANRDFAELNAAYKCLQDPKERLGHLMELESGTKISQVHRVPVATADLFIQISGMFRRIDSLLEENARATSPLLKAQVFERIMDANDQLGKLQEEIARKRLVLIEALKSIDQKWEIESAAPGEQRSGLLSEIEEVYRMLSYLNRWTVQIQERAVRCAECAFQG